MKAPELKTTVEPEELGAALALAAHDVQAKFLNAFAKELTHACLTHYSTEMQLHYIRDELTAEAKDYCQTLGSEKDD